MLLVDQLVNKALTTNNKSRVIRTSDPNPKSLFGTFPSTKCCFPQSKPQTHQRAPSRNDVPPTNLSSADLKFQRRNSPSAESNTTPPNRHQTDCCYFTTY